ncbi:MULTISPECIES: hypothetical protein [Hyphomonas]|uniref:Uncharacterized protein n=1 Tax=Hyphomonas atlantica TaxID=1280948 RepID=A0A059DZF8_9PROT|nr:MULTISPECIES: hypothetical protein [Hyphomonas]KCZ59727.1 hypothetical protein HY36_06255 [Hyphomonas atlantica]MAM08694.1 hypothetical protein [Hyphomonas sp.]HAE93315.1 hypothetical protein [Hyphomonas atlantica]|tara:strand:+ start:790 stop:1593 length:804 start_codon:yes stop_codon:yes gene_type:complete
MTRELSIPALVSEAWSLAAKAARPSLVIMLALIVAGGIYTFAIGPGSAMGDAAPAIAALVVFFVGVEFSLVVYRAMLETRTGDRLRLAHANLSIYVAFLFVGVFIGFFLLILPGILLKASGRVDVDAETPPEVVQAALVDMLPTAYGAVLILACLAGAAVLFFMALRLLLVGSATVATGQTLVFRTWPWTKGHALKLAVAGIATHIVPFSVALAVNWALRDVWGGGAIGSFLSGAVGMALLVPFLLSGHGLAVAALSKLHPDIKTDE